MPTAPPVRWIPHSVWPARIIAVSMTTNAIARPIQAQMVWNSLSLIIFTRVQTTSPTERIAVITAVDQPRIENRVIRTGRSSHTRIAAAKRAA